MESDTVRESRRMLRRVQDHMYQAHIHLGAIQETVGLVDVMHHPANRLASLNYVTPRRSTAWVSADMIEQGLTHLKSLDRTPRVQYIEGLYPPLFSKTMLDLGLRAEWELPVMIYPVLGFAGIIPSLPKDRQFPDGVRIESVIDQSGINLWWYIWRNAHYDVITLGIEPLFVGRDMSAMIYGHQLDLILYHNGFPVGVARLSIHDQTAHLLAWALMKEARVPEMMRTLHLAALQAALDRKCTLIYAPGETEVDRRVARELGFVDFGSIVCYTVMGTDAVERKDEYHLGQPVLALR